MIRRACTDVRRRPCWLLFSQIQHADLAAQLAGAWNLSELGDVLRSELLWTVAHHDDGWDVWEHHPELDEQGRPRSFLEMPVGAATSIWSRSIDQARQHSPLAGLLVANHFLQLLATGSSSCHPSAAQFAGRYRAVADACRRSAVCQRSELASERNLQTLQDYLQLFDVLSLTLCCAPLNECVEYRLPSGTPLVCRPVSTWQLQLEPWPCSERSLRLGLLGRQVPQRVYHDAQDLKQAGQLRQVHWMLTDCADTAASTAAD